MQRPTSVVLFTAVALIFGIATMAVFWSTDGGALVRILGIVLGFLWIGAGMGLFLGDDGARILLLWLFAVSFVGAIFQLFAEMYPNGFAWLGNGLGLRESAEAARFFLSMGGLYGLSGHAAITFCKRGGESHPAH